MDHIVTLSDSDTCTALRCNAGEGLVDAIASKILVEITRFFAPLRMTSRQVIVLDAPMRFNKFLNALAILLLALSISSSFASVSNFYADSLIQPKTLFGSFIEPFRQLAQERRAQRERSDAQWSARADPELNRDRINFVIYIFGDNYEPSSMQNEVTQTGSYTIVSINVKTGQYDKITLSRDFDSPEVARRKTGDAATINPSTRIGEAFDAGGFDFARLVIEDATGLSADFQLNVPDTFISDMIDTLGGVDVEIPEDIGLYEFYVNGKQFAARDFPAGQWHLDGITALGYAKAMPKGDYTMDTERVLRSQAVLDAAFAKLRQELNSFGAITLVPKLFELVTQEKNLAAIETDFDLKHIFNLGLSQAARNFLLALVMHGFDLGIPKSGQGLYVGAEYQGGGGGWRIPPGDMLISIDGNVNGDPVKDYWIAVREFIRGKLIQ